jgi:branched-chain amino acid transport system substrate-binding protein
LHGALLAIEEANAAGGPGGYEVRTLVLDNGTATAGQYDPAQAAINARKMVADPTVVAAIGPMASGSGKAMAPLLSQGNLATVTPSSTSPDLTNPKYAEQFRPGRQGDLLPHRDDRCLPGSQHGQFHGGPA